MKRTFSICVSLVALAAVPVFGSAQREARYLTDYRPTASVKAGDTLPERITRLTSEISKGEKVYSPEELQVLKHKQKEATDALKSLQKPGK